MCLLYYAIDVDGPILPSLSNIGSEQNKATEATSKAIVKLLNYFATFPDAVVKYIARDMCLWIDSDSSYLSSQKSRSRAGGFFYPSDNLPKYQKTKIRDQTDQYAFCEKNENGGRIGRRGQIRRFIFQRTRRHTTTYHVDRTGSPPTKKSTSLKKYNTTANSIVNNNVRQRKS